MMPPSQKGKKKKIELWGSNYVQLINTEKGFWGVFFGFFGWVVVPLALALLLYFVCACYRLTKLS
jgi:hypothetical protein